MRGRGGGQREGPAALQPVAPETVCTSPSFALQVISGAMTPGGLMSFLLYSVNVGFSFANLSTVYTDVMKAAGATTRVFEIIDSGAAPTATTTAGPEPRALAPVPGTAYQRAVERFVAPPPPPESLLPPALLCTAADAGSGSHPCPRAGVAIVFDAVSFTYPSRASPVLSALSLTLRGGEHVALVGGSGSGKTTLAGLLLRLYDPSAGGVYLWGRALSDIDTGELRRRVTTVPQELSLFSGTIAENIRYGRGDASDAEVVPHLVTLPLLRAEARPLLSGWLILYRGGGGGWVRGQKKVCVPKIDLQVRAPLINFIFFLRKNFLMWVGGWVGQPKSRGANLTPPPSITKQRPAPTSSRCPYRGQRPRQGMAVR